MSRVDGLKGTRDFYPDEMRLRRWIEDRWREVAEGYGFEEYDGPVIEPLELYVRKSGQEIVRQLYTFEDQGGRAVALRPEMTPSMARMIAARSQGLPKPIKWYSFPRLFRYERPQRGRFREFFQLNLDIVGVEGVEADAEIIAAGIDTLRACGLDASDFVVRYSDRRLLDVVLDGLGIKQGRREEVYAALDKLLRSGRESVLDGLKEAGVDRGAAERLMGAIGRRSLEGLKEALTDLAIENEIERLRELERYLGAYGVEEFCEFDAAVVRGLAYYTGIVFEMYDRAGELRALCGGGRFDDLLRSVGGEDLPAVGFGLGDAVLLELLSERGGPPELPPERDVEVIPVSHEDRPTAVAVATTLRQARFTVGLALRDQAVGKALRRASQVGARHAVVIGERERESGRVTVRDLGSGDETEMTIDELVRRLSETA